MPLPEHAHDARGYATKEISTLSFDPIGTASLEPTQAHAATPPTQSDRAFPEPGTVDHQAAEAERSALAEQQRREQEAREEQEALDIFDSLLGGPGVIPVGGATPPFANSGDVHILSDSRPTLLNEPPCLLPQHGHSDDIGAILEGSDTPSYGTQSAGY